MFCQDACQSVVRHFQSESKINFNDKQCKHCARYAEQSVNYIENCKYLTIKEKQCMLAEIPKKGGCKVGCTLLKMGCFRTALWGV